jgi:hypothetical protein
VIARILLGPVLLWQGRRVRATALRLLIVGDSSAASVGACHQDEALARHLLQVGQPLGLPAPFSQEIERCCSATHS